MKHIDNFVKKLVKDSTLNKNFKSEILNSMIYRDDNDFVIELDVCLEFLEKKGFKIYDITDEEDVKLENYLKKYISENIPNFPYEITTEDGVVIFEPNVKYNFSKDELPKKYPKKTNLYTVDFNFLDKRDVPKVFRFVGDMSHLGRTSWFSFQQIGGLSKEEAEQLKNMIENEEWHKIDFLKYYKNNKKDKLDYILDHRNDFELSVNMRELKRSEIY